MQYPTPAPAIAVPRIVVAPIAPLAPDAAHLGEALEHLLTLMHERRLSPAEHAALESALLAEAHRPTPGAWALDLLEQLSLDLTTERRPLPLLLCGEVETLARLLRRMAGPFGLEVEEAPWGLDWSIPALQLRVYLETDGAPAYEILRL
ncbi:MAG: hypothetical protein KC933_27285 [Myxococcales bacterium]|nr:hypothetical protein [Myxococcales bacterium]MCB9646430.1 hypothetical protein [Deltaproteobacteria bacterium]